MTVGEKKKFKLRNLLIDRADLVDRGANQEAFILLSKRDDGDVMERIAAIQERIAKHPHEGGGSQKDHGNWARGGAVKTTGAPDYTPLEDAKPKSKPKDSAPKGSGASGSGPSSAAGALEPRVADPNWDEAYERGEAERKAQREKFSEAAKAKKEAEAEEKDEKVRYPVTPFNPHIPLNKNTPGRRRALKALARAKKRNKARIAAGKNPIVEGKEVSRSSLK